MEADLTRAIVDKFYPTLSQFYPTVQRQTGGAGVGVGWRAFNECKLIYSADSTSSLHINAAKYTIWP